jgi:hypothetical protein
LNIQDSTVSLPNISADQAGRSQGIGDPARQHRPCVRVAEPELDAVSHLRAAHQMPGAERTVGAAQVPDQPLPGECQQLRVAPGDPGNVAHHVRSRIPADLVDLPGRQGDEAAVSVLDHQ